MRLSPPRVLVRAALLAVGGAFMLWKAETARRGAAELDAAGALLLRRVALVEGLVGLLALATAIVALLSLRTRPRRHTLRLRDRDRGGDPT